MASPDGAAAQPELARLRRLLLASDDPAASPELRETVLLRLHAFIEAQAARGDEDEAYVAPLRTLCAARAAALRASRPADASQPRLDAAPPGLSAAQLAQRCGALGGVLPPEGSAGRAAALAAGAAWATLPLLPPAPPPAAAAAAAAAAPVPARAPFSPPPARVAAPAAAAAASPPQPQPPPRPPPAAAAPYRAPAPVPPSATWRDGGGGAKRKPEGASSRYLLEPETNEYRDEYGDDDDDGRARRRGAGGRGRGRQPDAADSPPPPPPPRPMFASATDKYLADMAKDGKPVPPSMAATSAPVTAPYQNPCRAGGAASGGGPPAPGGMKPYRDPTRRAAAAPGGGGAPGMARAVAAHAGGPAAEEDPTCGLSPAVLARLCPGGKPVPECIKKLEPHLVERICNEILEQPRGVAWDEIAGLEHAKAVVQEVAVWPLLAPTLFRGARAVPRGLLLFGPPGTGKTLIGRAIASQCAATFFSISAASLGSKWIGEGEKLVRALFAVATVLAPSVVFVDEIDALLSARKGGEGEHEASRRLKTEFLVQMEGLDGGGEDRPVLLVGATNRPAELDEAARRRLAKQIYIPLPCAAARRQLVVTMLRAGAGEAGAAACAHTLSDADLDTLAARTEGYSGSDMKHLVQEAARAPLRELRSKNAADFAAVRPEHVRPLTLDDFRRAAKQVRPSVTAADVAFHEEWNARHGAQAQPAGGADSDGEWG